jgi:hypothetical protein
MRVQDVAEVRASGRNDLRAVVDEGVRRSVMCYAVRVDGRLAAIFGLAPYGGLLSNIGVPWMLGTPEVPRHRRILARYSKPYIASMLAAYPHLINAVHARNTVAVRWLRHAGFTLHAAQPYGPHGEPFHVFEMTRNV